MAAARHETRQRGLPSLNEARAGRRSALVRGKYQLAGGLPPRFWLWAGVVLAGASVIYWKLAQGQLESQKSAVMAKQRAVAQVLTPEVVPLTSKIEARVMELARDIVTGVSPEADLATIQTTPSIYLRLRLANAREEKSIRKAASESLHDGFVACLFLRKDAGDPTRGAKCKNSSDCEPGQLCNEYEVCSPPPRPYNMRLAYRAMSVLGSAWSDALHETGNEYEVRVRERELERVAHDDVPIAIQMMSSSKLVVVVLDEDPPGGLPPKLDGFETDEQRVQRVDHWARVGIWEMKTGKRLASLRAQAAGQFVSVGEKRAFKAESQAAQQRQANSCALALQAKSLLGAAKLTAEGDERVRP